MEETKKRLRSIVYLKERLEALGWQDIKDCPKDGTEFYCFEFGSTEIHKCYLFRDRTYMGGIIYTVGSGEQKRLNNPVMFRKV